MKDLLAVARLHGGCAALTCIAVFALGFVPAGAAAPKTALPVPGAGQWLFVLLLAGLGIAALFILLYMSGHASARRRRLALRERLERLDFPAAISGIDGRLKWVNRSMRAAYGDRPGGILLILGNGVEVDAGLIYRLANSAREMGFALEHVRCMSSDEMVVLSAQFEMPNHLVWTVFPADRLLEIAHDDSAGTYETASFAHLSVDGSGVASANPQFHKAFGDPNDLSDGFPDDILQNSENYSCTSCLLPGIGGLADPNAYCIVRVPGECDNAHEVFSSRYRTA